MTKTVRLCIIVKRFLLSLYFNIAIIIKKEIEYLPFTKENTACSPLEASDLWGLKNGFKDSFTFIKAMEL